MTDSQSADAAQPITQIDFARAGVVTPQMAAVAAAEGREPEDIRAAVATGRIAIPANIHHASLAPAGRRFHPGGRPSFHEGEREPRHLGRSGR